MTFTDKQLRQLFIRRLNIVRDLYYLRQVKKFQYVKSYTRQLFILSNFTDQECTNVQICCKAGSVFPNICGFIDGTARPISRPSYNQKDQYSGYKKEHQIPKHGRRHDAAILTPVKSDPGTEEDF
ncbi:unnamed protein product [Allacma fusca]|uniref:Uncharacterized protein n=1 Tax=Allacma fusca TaxID=39272 RepID=A0A8J2PB60_9HEXA|nr:unnamed protein product [Allacma fusca]